MSRWHVSKFSLLVSKKSVNCWYYKILTKFSPSVTHYSPLAWVQCAIVITMPGGQSVDQFGPDTNYWLDCHEMLYMDSWYPNDELYWICWSPDLSSIATVLNGMSRQLLDEWNLTSMSPSGFIEITRPITFHLALPSGKIFNLFNS